MALGYLPAQLSHLTDGERESQKWEGSYLKPSGKDSRSPEAEESGNKEMWQVIQGP